ncbi:HAD family hydrolase [Stenoxybacter acetivorans]|uniref:HAD family hydrolase n=1 Tax=Stenoxybacter acetivorans TaxID=422441 RepID=UPI0005689162|nr:HAD family hydrolase [Stenoxybacter acetivorans]
MNIQAVLFDLDGTLADTALDLGGALNRLLKRKGLPEKSMDEIRPIASHGANGLIRLGAGIETAHSEHKVWRAAYLAEYENGFADKTVLFDGVNEMLSVLTQRGIAWGIITNKPHSFTHRLVPQLHFASAPSVVVSGDTTTEPKPSTKPMFYACEQMNVSPKNCWYVGDAERDIQAGNNAGMHTALALWGYLAKDDRIETWQAEKMLASAADVLNLPGIKTA